MHYHNIDVCTDREIGGIFRFIRVGVCEFLFLQIFVVIRLADY